MSKLRVLVQSLSQSAKSKSPSAPAPKSPPALQSIWIEPAGPTILSGKQVQLKAKGDYNDGDQQDLTRVLEWRSAAPKIVTVDKQGLAVAGSMCGSTTLTATDRKSGVRATIKFTVAPPGTPLLESIAISPRIKSIVVGEQQQFRATGKYSDGHTEDLTDVVDWSPSWPEGMSVDRRGLATAGPKGPESEPEPMSLTATDLDNDVRDTIDFVLERSPTGESTVNWEYQSIAVSPQNVRIAAGAKQQFTATGKFDDGTSRDVTRFVLWSSSAPTIVSIDRLGAAIAQAASGSATITAKDSMTEAYGTTEVTVDGAVEDEIEHKKQKVKEMMKKREEVDAEWAMPQKQVGDYGDQETPSADDGIAQKKQKAIEMMKKRGEVDAGSAKPQKQSGDYGDQENLSADDEIEKKKQKVKEMMKKRESFDAE